jgi:MFS-type transporter involved in bile tolerance (Atg22 family)
MTTVESGKLRQRSTLDLVRDLTHQASTLVHQEVELVKLEVQENIELAKQEMAEKGKRAGMGVAALTAAGGAALLALGAFTAFLVLALDEIMPNWLAALCAALLWVVVAIPLALYGRKKIDQVGTPVPKRTIESVKEDVEWLKHQKS